MSATGTLRTVGGLLPPDLVARVVAGDRDLPGMTPVDYHLAAGETPREAANRAWSYLTGVWAGFRAARQRLPDGDPAVGLTRERWLLVLLRELGYGRVPTVGAGGVVVDDRAFPVSHVWGATPVHLLGWGVDLDRRTPRVAGAAERAPHAMLQELLNRSDEHLWGLLSNGRRLRLLRDSASLSGQAYVEFDLEAMFEGEVFADFVALFLLAHQSRVELLAPGAPLTACRLEQWRTAAAESGVRARGQLRLGVQAAVERLGTGFLHGPGGAELNRRLQAGPLAEDGLRLEDYHRALLRLVYRLLFLFVAEDRDALLRPDADPQARERYTTYFSTARLRRLALRRHGTRHSDLWEGLRVVVEALGRPRAEDGTLTAGSDGRDDGLPALGLPGLGGLFDPGELDTVFDGVAITNEDLLAAVRHLSVVQLRGQPKRSVDYRNLDVEELGSIYESLLELVPRHDPVDRRLELVALSGNERKTSGSYYTPGSLIDLVLDEALDPVLDDAEKSASTLEEAEQALLRVTVCDPACGSGHFLVAAARRIATRVAMARTGEVDPTPADQQAALYDVVARCIYGIDVNEMAADLAKVSLWLDSLTPGRPLAFLDAHVKVGNALLGTTPALLAAGIPDSAYAVIQGDDPKVAAALRRRNRDEQDRAEQRRSWGTEQLTLGDENEQPLHVGNLALGRKVRDVVARMPLSLADVHVARQRFEALDDDPDVARAHRLADTWCAAFVQLKADGGPGITYDTLVAVEQDRLGADVRAAVEDLRDRYRFFHWHLEFPEVFTVPEGGAGTPTGWTGGFSCIAGNPPWERVKLQEQEFFATRDPAIATAANAAARKRLIKQLPDESPGLWAEWAEARRRSEAESHLLRSSGRYPLTGRGDVNTYSVFAETMRAAVAERGRAGVITPTGLGTDATTAEFFADTLRAARLAVFYDFENEAPKIFEQVTNRQHFAVTVVSGGEPLRHLRLASGLRRVTEVGALSFNLSPDEILAMNPNTGTLPLFRSRVDAETTLGAYRRHPVLMRDSDRINPWGLRFGTLLHMANDSHLFSTPDVLRDDGAAFDGWAWVRGKERWLPLYEAKLLGHWDHRFSTYEAATEKQLNKGTLPRLTEAQHGDPYAEPLARYWVAESEVDKAVDPAWDRDWFFGWRDIARASDARTMVPSVLPRSAAGDKVLIAMPNQPTLVPLLQATWSSLALDYIARQKLSGTGMKYFIVKQVACPTPEVFDERPAWADLSLGNWVRPRVLELTYTSHRIAGYARDVQGLPDGADPGPPFRWLPERRELIRAELDAAMFDVYGLRRDEVEHVLDSFFVVRKNEEREHGEFRTRRLVLEAYDAMSRAAETGSPYRTPLDPPPGEGPRHPPARP